MKSIYLLITFSLLVYYEACEDKQQQGTTSDFNIVFTGNVNGEIEPCG